MTRSTLALLLALSVASAGCYGSYGAFHAVHRWNGHATGSREGNSLIHFLFWIVPVYELCLIGDVIIFNNVEFISGSNPFQ